MNRDPMNNVTLINFDKYSDNNGVLCAYEQGQYVPFDIRRVFTVSAKKGELRGNHAHMKCSQLMICVSGEITVTCDDGSSEDVFFLDNMGIGLLVPPGIWAREEYMINDSVLMVLCDRGYEENDYIHDYDSFKLHVGL